MIIFLLVNPEELAFGTDVDKIKVLLGDMIKCHHLLIRAYFFVIQALGNIPLLKCGIVNDVLRVNQVGRLGLQICFVYAILKLVAFLSPLLMVAYLTLIEKSPLAAVFSLVGVEHVVAVLAKPLSSELSGH